MSGIGTIVIVAAVMGCVLGGITLLAHIYDLNGIKSKTVGDGQHGTARWATSSEIRKTYRHIPFTPQKWRKQALRGETPTVTPKKKGGKEKPVPQGIVVGCRGDRRGGRGQNGVLAVPVYRIRLRERDVLPVYGYKRRRHAQLRDHRKAIRI